MGMSDKAIKYPTTDARPMRTTRGTREVGIPLPRPKIYPLSDKPKRGVR